MKPVHRYAARAVMGTIASLGATAALAGALNVPDIPVDATLLRNYQCQGGQSLHVTYYNKQGGQSFALLSVKDKPMLFVDTMAGSGGQSICSWPQLHLAIRVVISLSFGGFGG